MEEKPTKELVVLEGGAVAIVTGKGITLGGAVATADITDMPKDDLDAIQKDLGSMKATRRGGRITVKVPGRSNINVKEQKA